MGLSAVIKDSNFCIKLINGWVPPHHWKTIELMGVSLGRKVPGGDHKTFINKGTKGRRGLRGN